MERRDFLGAALGGAGIAGLAIASASTAAAQQPAPTGAKSKLDEVLARGKVIVGVTSEAPPFGYIDEKGELVGFDIDVAKLVAKGIFGDESKIELFKQGFAARWPNVQNGSIDFGIMVTTVYADRALQRRLYAALHRLRHRLGSEEGQPHQERHGPQQGRVHRRSPDHARAGGARQATLSKCQVPDPRLRSRRSSMPSRSVAPRRASSTLPLPSTMPRTTPMSAFSTSG